MSTDGSDRSIGICCGSTTVSLVELHAGNGRRAVSAAHSVRHEGLPGRAIEELMSRAKVTAADRVAVTGRRFRALLDLPTLSEPEAFEEALRYVAADSWESDGRRSMS